MRAAARRDRNDGDHRKHMEARGWLMLPVSVKGLPDYLAAMAGRLVLVECKVPGETFTPAQVKTFERLRLSGVPVYVLAEEGDAERLTAGTLPPWTPEGMKVRSAAKRVKQRPHRPGVDRARTVEEQCTSHGCSTSRASGLGYCGACIPRSRPG
jgi:hypothetical protein